MLNLSHKKLIAWQRAIEFLPVLYQLAEKLPNEERYNLVSQMKRAGISVSNNLAEGSSRKSKLEKNRFFEIARSSLVEIDNCIEASLILKFLSKNDINNAETKLEEMFKLISGLIASNNK